MATRRSRGWAAFILVAFCALYAVGLAIVVAAVPAVDGETLLEYGGASSLAIVAQPLVVTGLMWTLLRRRCTTGSRAAITAAWTAAGLFFVYSVLGALSIAAGAFPASAALLAATALTPSASDAGDRNSC